MSAILTKYKQEALPKLKEEFGIKNDLAIPKIKKRGYSKIASLAKEVI